MFIRPTSSSTTRCFRIEFDEKDIPKLDIHTDNLESYLQENQDYIYHILGQCACKKCFCKRCTCNFWPQRSLKSQSTTQYNSFYNRKHSQYNGPPLNQLHYSTKQRLNTDISQSTVQRESYKPFNLQKQEKIRSSNTTPQRRTFYGLTTNMAQYPDWQGKGGIINKPSDFHPKDLKFISESNYRRDFQQRLRTQNYSVEDIKKKQSRQFCIFNLFIFFFFPKKSQPFLLEYPNQYQSHYNNDFQGIQTNPPKQFAPIQIENKNFSFQTQYESVQMRSYKRPQNRRNQSIKHLLSLLKQKI